MREYIDKRKNSFTGECLFPSVFALVIFLAVLAVKGIFPFGSNTIDYYDMGQTNAPLYYHIWDVLHFKSRLFYSWYINEGQNLSMASAIQWNISIFNLFFLFIPRRLCFEFLGLFTGLRIFFMTFNMAFFLKRTIKAPTIYRMIMSLGYGLCGYTLTHYTIPTYLDTAALFPLYMLSLYYLLTVEDSAWPKTVFSLFTGYMTALSYYFGFMNLIFILLYSGTYIFLIEKKEKRAKRTLDLSLSVVFGLMLSAFMLVPAALQMMDSSRFNSNMKEPFWQTLRNILCSVGADMYYIKWFILAGSTAAIVITVIGFIRYRKEKRTLLFIFLVCFYPCALIPFESINLLWHMGTYYHYPIRCGYMIPFVLICTGTYFCGRLFTERHEELSVVKYVIFPIASAILGCMLVFAVLRIYLSRTWEIHELFKAWLIFIAVMVCIYLLCIFIKKPEYITLFITAELVCGAFVGYGMPNFHDKFSSEPEQSGEYINTISDLASVMKINESRIDRIKNPDTSLNTNYGFVIRRSTVGGWANTARRQQLDNAMAFGYNAHFMRIMDSGGTYFSDALLHVTEVLTCVPKLYKNDDYRKVSEEEGYVLYDAKHVMPFVMKADSSFTGAGSDVGSVEKTVNTYYRQLCRTAGMDPDRDILEVVKGPDIHVSSKKALYLQGGSSEKISVNKETVPVPTMGDMENTAYPASFNSNYLYLGIYEDEDVKLEGIDGAKITALDMVRLEKLCEAQNAVGTDITDDNITGMIISFETDAKENEMALIPLSYTKGFSAYVNDEKREVKDIDSLFIGVELDPGKNEVEIRFVPYGFKTGIMICLIGLICAVVLPPFIDGVILQRISLYVFGAVFLAALIILYVVPLAAFVIHQVVKRVNF